jgi:O-antigen/teichoic acid export membrane protein
MQLTRIKEKFIGLFFNADFHNLSSAVVLKALTSLIYIILIPFAIGKMGTNNYGITVFFLTMHGYVTLFDTGITYAVNYLYTRELALDRTSADNVYYNSILIYLCLALFVFFATFALSEKLSVWAFNTTEYSTSFIIFGAILFFSVFDSLMTSVIQGHEKLMLVAISRFCLDVVKIIGVVVTAFGGVKPQDVVLFILAAVLVKLAVNAYSFSRLKISSRFQFDKKIILGILRLSLPSMGISACMLVALMTDKFLVSGKINPSAFAVYSVVIDLTSKVYFVYYSLTSVVYPKLIKNKTTGMSVRNLNYAQFAGILALIVIYYLPLNIFSDKIIGFFVHVDESVAPLLLLASLNAVLYLVTTVFETSLNSSAKMKMSLFAHISGVVALLSALHFLFSSYGAMGALISVTIMYLVMNTFFVYFQLKYRVLG